LQNADVEVRQPVAPDAANAKKKTDFYENLAKMKMKIAM